MTAKSRTGRRPVGALRREAMRQATARRERRRRARRRALRWLGVIAGVALASTGLFLGDGGPARLTLPLDHPPPSYRVTYRNNLDGVIEEDSLTVLRPWFGRHEERKGPQLVGGELTNQDGLWIYNSNPAPGGWVKAGGGRQAPTGAYRVVPVLRMAAQHGLASVLGTDTVLGRPCTIVRTGAPLSESLKRPTRREHADLWVDKVTGIVLREDWVLNDKRVEQMVATSFDPDTALSALSFAPAPISTNASLAKAFAEVTEPLSPQRRAELDGHVRTPPGYRDDGADMIIRNDAQFGISASTIERYVAADGSVLTVEHDALSGNLTPQGLRVDLGHGRIGYLVLGLGNTALHLANGSTEVIIHGDDPVALIAAARSYQAQH